MSLFGDCWQLAVPSSVPHPGRARCLWVSCCITSVYIMVTVCGIIGLIHVDSLAAQMFIRSALGRRLGHFFFILSSCLSKAFLLFTTALSQARIWVDSLFCRALLEVLPSCPSTLLSTGFLWSSLQLQKSSVRWVLAALLTCACLQGAALFSSWWPIEANTWEFSFPCLSSPLTQQGANLFLSLWTTHAELGNAMTQQR